MNNSGGRDISTVWRTRLDACRHGRTPPGLQLCSYRCNLMVFAPPNNAPTVLFDSPLTEASARYMKSGRGWPHLSGLQPAERAEELGGGWR